MAALFFVALITRAPPGPFTPAPFGFAKALMRPVRGIRPMTSFHLLLQESFRQ